MITSDGPQPIVFRFQDDVAGKLIFDSYREEPEAVDSRLHVESGGSWADHKQAFAEQQIAGQRKTRDTFRTDMQDVPVSTKNAARFAAAHAEKQEVARTMRPNGTGAGLIIKKD
jgi:regulatory protein YycH of two-component signal transduction system YycFG